MANLMTTTGKRSPEREHNHHAVERWTIGGLAAVAIIVGVTIALTDLPAQLILATAAAYIAAVGCWLAIIDFRTHRLPNRLIIPSYGVLSALLAVSWVATGDGTPVLRSLASATVTGLLYGAMSRWGSLGQGDVKLGALLGLFLGWISWNAAIAGPFLGFLLGAIVAIALLLRGKRKNTYLAFGPYLIAGALTVALQQLLA